ncbi:MAG: MaoC family dehydratase N-terminal domain-containing protein [Pseudomonadota bacterium]
MTVVGRSQTFNDPMDPSRAEALAALLDVPLPGDALPAFFHQAYFWEMPRRSDLGRDGHPGLGAFLPDQGLPRRMWAGGRLTFEAALRTGAPASKTTTIMGIEEKTGHTGRLAFVTLRHEVHQSGHRVVTEEQDLVYREAHRVGATPPRVVQAPPDEAARSHGFDPALLFRYSALTYNGHRIHYDAAYAQDVEGYADVVVHGPLLAQIMMLRAAERGALRRFTFRAVRPLLVSERATFCQEGATLWVRNPAGALNMTAEAEWHDTDDPLPAGSSSASNASSPLA